MSDSQPKIGVLEQERQRRQDLAGRGADPAAIHSAERATRATLTPGRSSAHGSAAATNSPSKLSSQPSATRSSARGPAVPTAERKTRSHDDGTHPAERPPRSRQCAHEGTGALASDRRTAPAFAAELATPSVREASERSSCAITTTYCPCSRAPPE